MVDLIKQKSDLIIDKMRGSKYEKKEIQLVKQAINFAVKYHDGQLRKSGEPFVTHPLQVASILIDWNMDSDTICAGILHDVLEDTSATENDLKKIFSDQVIYLVNSVTKISKYSNKNRHNNVYGSNKQSYLIQVFLNISKDLRVLFIKIADRYHNMKTIFHLKKEKQKRIALETKEIYANLAGRLGMYKIKIELLDICMNILDHSIYVQTKKIVDNKVTQYNDIYQEIIQKIVILLQEKNIKFDWSSRVKSIYSSYKKMQIDEEILDLFAMRIIVENTLDCYLVLGIIHTMFYNVKNTFKDFISTPKANLYQSLHTGIFYKGMNMEIQIRTTEMDRIANFGIASHWRYKEDKEANPFENEVKDLFTDNNQDNGFEKIDTIKKIAKQKFINVYNQNNEKWENVNENLNVFEYAALTNVKLFPYLKDIYVNNSKVSLFSSLDSGDIIKIIYNPKKTINKNWKNWTRDADLIKWIDNEIDAISLSVEGDVSSFIKNINKKFKSNVSKKQVEEFISETFDITNIKDFLENMKIIKINRNDIYDLFGNNESKRNEIIEKIKSNSWKWIWENSLFRSTDNYYIKKIIITKCCSKIPYQSTIGILNDDILEVHKYDCPNVNNENQKIIILNWNKEKLRKTDRNFRARLILTGAFTNNTSISIISAIQKYKAVISSYIIIKNKTNRTFTCELVLYVKNYSNIEKLMTELLNRSIITNWKLI